MKDIGSEFCSFHSGEWILAFLDVSLRHWSVVPGVCCQGSSGLRRIFGFFVVHLICGNEGIAIQLNVMNSMPRTFCHEFLPHYCSSSDFCLMTYSKCHEPLIVVDLFSVLQVISAFRCVCVVLELPLTFIVSIYLSTCIGTALSFDIKDFCGNLLRKFIFG